MSKIIFQVEGVIVGKQFWIFESTLHRRHKHSTKCFWMFFLSILFIFFFMKFEWRALDVGTMMNEMKSQYQSEVLLNKRSRCWWIYKGLKHASFIKFQGDLGVSRFASRGSAEFWCICCMIATSALQKKWKSFTSSLTYY